MKKEYKRGFTLIEIIAVIIIIGILTLITVPAISQYIKGSQDTTYETHETNMKNAVRNMTINCIEENKDCNLPTEGQKSLVYLNDIIENGYLTELKDPKGEGTCSSVLSYVEIENTGNSNYDYNACLYCGSYKTDNENCVKYASDGDMPTCGENTTGESTKWTNQDRTITVPCLDATSGCTKNEFSKTFSATTDISNVTIVDQTGNMTECPVNVYVDKDAPTCSLEIIDGILETTGWYSGNVKVRLKVDEMSDVGSGILTYGIGTSVENRNYNKETVIELKNGYTTVMGYVKDIAGNEGICSVDVRVGVPKPEFVIEYGYQIYPNKESYTLENMTASGTTLTSTSTDPMISFTGLGNYKNVNRAVIHLNSGVPTTTIGQIFYSSGTHSEANSKTFIMPQGATKLEVEIPTGTYSNIRIDLGELNAKAYNIKRIELMVGDRSTLYTNKDVTINLVPINEKVPTTKFSFDGGTTWQTTNSKTFTQNYSGQARTENDLPLTSLPKNIGISNIDKILPSCSIDGIGEKTENGIFINGATVQFLSVADGAATSENAMSNVKSYGFGSPTGNKTDTLLTSDAEKTFTGYVVDYAGNENTCQVTLIGDSVPPTVSYSVAGGSYNANKSIVITPKDTGSGVAHYNVHVYKSGTLTNQYNNLTSATYTVTLSTEGSYTVYTQVVDKAGNMIVQTPNNGSNWYYQSYTIDKTGPTCTVTKSNTGSTSGVKVTWSCSDSAGVSSVTVNSSAKSASGSVSGQKSTVTIVAKDGLGNSKTYTASVSSSQNCWGAESRCCNTCYDPSTHTRRCDSSLCGSYDCGDVTCETVYK